eukprot:199027_1
MIIKLKHHYFSMFRSQSLSISFSLLLVSLVSSSPTYCNTAESEFYCSIARPLETIRNPITQNDIDTKSISTTSNVWHINSTVYLPPSSSWNPGLSTLPWFPNPIIYIENDGILSIQNTGTQQVSIRSNVFICDHAEFRIINSTFRAEMDFGFQFILWAQDHAKLRITDSTVAMGKESIDGHWLNYIRMNASCYVSNMTGIDGAWEFATLDNATSHVINTNALTEMYISQHAQLSVENMQSMDIFFALCPSDTPITLSNLPPIDTNLTFAIAQPDGFTFSVVNTFIFAFACELYTGSNVIFSNIPQQSNFAIGMNIDDAIQTDLNVSTSTGSPPVFDGFDSIYTTVFNDTFVFAYMLWMNHVNVRISDGSEVGDVYATQNVNVSGNNLRLVNGNNRAQANSVIMLENSDILTFSVILPDGYLVLKNCTFPDTGGQNHIQNAGGYLWFVDNLAHSYPSHIYIEEDGKWFNVNITNVHYASHLSVDRANGIGIVGNIIEMNNNVFDCAVQLVYNANGAVILSNKVTANAIDEVVLSGDISNETPGEYTIIITFNIGSKSIDVLQRYITIYSTDTTDEPSLSPTRKTPSMLPSRSPSLLSTVVIDLETETSMHMVSTVASSMEDGDNGHTNYSLLAVVLILTTIVYY